MKVKKNKPITLMKRVKINLKMRRWNIIDQTFIFLTVIN